MQKGQHHTAHHLDYLIFLRSFCSLGKDKLGTAVVISIILASYILFFVFQITTEFATLAEVFSSNREKQLETTQSLAKITTLKFNIIEGILGGISVSSNSNGNSNDSSNTGKISVLSPPSVSATPTATTKTTANTTNVAVTIDKETSNNLASMVQQRLATGTRMTLTTGEGNSNNNNIKNDGNNITAETIGAAEITIVDTENRIIQSIAASHGDNEGNVLANNPNEMLFKVGDTLEYPWAINVQKFHIPTFSGMYDPKPTLNKATAPISSQSETLEQDENQNGEDAFPVISFAQPLFYLDKNYQAADAADGSNGNASYAGMIVLTLPSNYLKADFDSAVRSEAEEVALLDSDQMTYSMSSAMTMAAKNGKDGGGNSGDPISGTSMSHSPGTLFGDDIKEIQSGNDPKVVISSESFKSAGGDVVFKNADGEFLLSGFPVNYYGRAQYMLILESDTSNFYAKVEPILFQSRIQMFSILTATAVLTVIIASFISRNINLDKQVKEKTKELTESNHTIVAQKQQLENANEELRHLDALKTQFIGIASHELKNPIQPIILYAEMAKYGDVEKDEAIDVILKQAQKLKQLSADILEVSRIDSKNLILNKQRVKIGDLLQDLVRPYQKATAERKAMTKTIDAAATPTNNPSTNTSTITTITNADKTGKDDEEHELARMPKVLLDIDDNTEINIDALRISQVINNILQNAIKFTSGKEGGIVTIRKRTISQLKTGSIHPSDAALKNRELTSTSGVYSLPPGSRTRTPEISKLSQPAQQYIEIIISDTGPGIPREIMPKLFGKFITKDVNGLNKHGTGLGLYISRAIVEEHGGQISAHNNSDNENADLDMHEVNGRHSGASFKILLPL